MELATTAEMADRRSVSNADCSGTRVCIPDSTEVKLNWYVYQSPTEFCCRLTMRYPTKQQSFLPTYFLLHMALYNGPARAWGT